MLDETPRKALTFDDVLLLPRYADFLPKDADLRSRCARNFELAIPLVSSAMDTVTEWKTAVTMAREGGLGFIHKNLNIEEQAREVLKVKRAESGMILDPVTIHPTRSLRDALELMRQHNISGLPVVENERVVGILTSRDLRFQSKLDQSVEQHMTRKLVTVPPGVSQQRAKELLNEHRIEKLLVVGSGGQLVGLITIKDLLQAERYPNAIKDGLGRLRVGAAVGVGPDRSERVAALITAGADILTIDTAHGHTRAVIDTIREIKTQHPDTPLIAGNIATADAAQALIDAGVDGIKVGMGPGSICTTRVIAGIGVPQITAIADCAKVAAKKDIPVIADGGIKYSGDVVKAIAAGAHCVMIGSMFAGTDESPGQRILFQGRTYKSYRGMGSLTAMARGAKDRYSQGDVEDMEKLVPEGVEGRVPYRGSLSSIVYQLTGGLRSGMGYTGCRTIDALRTETHFIQQSAQGVRESHVHDVVVTQEAPNYS